MKKLTREGLVKLREQSKKKLLSRLPNMGNSVEVIVGMGETGIKSGGKEIVATFLEMIDKLDMGNVIIKQDASLSDYGNAPVVEVRVPGMDVVKYKQVTPALTVEILEKHVRDKNILDEHVFS